MAFSKLKALIRKAAARTYDQLWAAVGQVCNLFSDEECYNYFKAAGYEADGVQQALVLQLRFIPFHDPVWLCRLAGSGLACLLRTGREP